MYIFWSYNLYNNLLTKANQIGSRKGGKLGLISKQLYIFVKNRVICRIVGIFVYRFWFYKQNDILTKNWSGGKKESGSKLNSNVKNRVICRFSGFQVYRFWIYNLYDNLIKNNNGRGVKIRGGKNLKILKKLCSFLCYNKIL